MDGRSLLANADAHPAGRVVFHVDTVTNERDTVVSPWGRVVFHVDTVTNERDTVASPVGEGRLPGRYGHE
jgi:hypothetical protein